MFIYLAQPIDQAGTNEPLARVMNNIHDAVYKQGHSAFRPAQAYRLAHPPWDDNTTNAVDRINSNALLQVDGIIAVILPAIPTLGTISEIEFALNTSVPVCIITTEKLRQCSVQLASWEGRGARLVFCTDKGYLPEFSVSGVLAAEPVKEQLDVTGFNDLVPSFVEGRAIRPGDLQVVYMDPAAKQLRHAHDTDAGYDLATLGEAVLEYGVRTLIRTGIQAPPPEGWWGLIKARSSTQARGIQVNEAVIDAGYQGELYISVTLIDNHQPQTVIEAGTRLAQYILIPTFPGKVVRVAEFGPSLRGSRGWGSSGV